MSGIDKKHNPAYDGTNIPEAVGDRYYAQDMLRDLQYLINKVGLAVLDILGMTASFIMEGGIISLGSTPASTINLTKCIAYIRFDITVPNSWGSLPPTVTTSYKWVRVELPALTNQNVASLGATLDGVSVNYVKLKYKELETSTRNRAKKSGSYYSEVQDSYELTVDTIAVASDEVLLGSFVGDGVADLVLNPSNRSKNPGHASSESIRPAILALTGTFQTYNENAEFSDIKVDGANNGNIAFSTGPSYIGRILKIRNREANPSNEYVYRTLSGPGMPKAILTAKGDEVGLRYNEEENDLESIYIKKQTYDTGWIYRTLWSGVLLGAPGVQFSSLTGTPIIGETVSFLMAGGSGTVYADYWGTDGTLYFFGHIRQAYGYSSVRQYPNIEVGRTLTFLTSGAVGIVSVASQDVDTPMIVPYSRRNTALVDFDISVMCCFDSIGGVSGWPGGSRPAVLVPPGNTGNTNNQGYSLWSPLTTGLSSNPLLIGTIYVRTGSAGIGFLHPTTGANTGIASTTPGYYRIIATPKPRLGKILNDQ